MFDEGVDVDLGRGERVAKKSPFSWKSLPLSTLLAYRAEIDKCLPATQLSDMNLETEMLLQYHTLRELQADVIGIDDVPANQKAQVANTVTASLNKLTDMQEGLYTAERFKAIENLLIRTLSKLPENLAEAFLKDYRKVLEHG